MTYQITKNTAYNSIEIAFDSKPTEQVREALKTLKFRWHNIKKVWYGYADEQAIKKALDDPFEIKEAPSPRKAEKVNKYGVKIGDIFEASWGWEQTNVDFFQVVALVGECSVRVREVYPEITETDAVSGMSENRVYKITNELLPPAPRSIFIEDQEHGELKRIRPGYDTDPEEANKNCSIKIDSVVTAYKCNGETTKCYVSWYA